MPLTVDSTPEQVVSELQPLLTAVYDALDKFIPEAHEFFDRKNRDINRDLFPHLVRYEIREYLRQRGFDEVEELDGDVEIDEVPFNGLSFKYAGAHVRILKAKEASLPGASSKGRRDWYQQRFLFSDGADAVVVSLNLVLLWDVDSRGNLVAVYLACPKDGNSRRGEASWQVTIPHPVLTISGPPTETAAEQSVDDLPLTKLQDSQSTKLIDRAASGAK